MAIYEVVLQGTLDSEPMLHVLHYDITGSSDLQAFVDAIRTELSNDLMAALVPSVGYTGCVIRLDSPGSVGVLYQFTSGVIVGTNSNPNYFGNIAANVRKLTGGTTRPTQGRIYQSGIPALASNTDGYLPGTYQSDLNDGWENLRVIEFDGAGEGVMQIKASNPSAPNTSAYNVVASFSTRGRLSTQKRRNYNTS